MERQWQKSLKKENQVNKKFDYGNINLWAFSPRLTSIISLALRTSVIPEIISSHFPVFNFEVEVEVEVGWVGNCWGKTESILYCYVKVFTTNQLGCDTL